MAIFSDPSNKFQILDYTPTHNQLLFRSMRSSGRDYNIDVLFKGVNSILVPTILMGIEISLFEVDSTKNYLVTDYDFKMTRDYRIFSLKASSKIFFVNAMSFGVFHNELNILETSIGRYDRENFGENVLWYMG